MSTTPQLVFQIRPESYAALSMDAFESLGSSASAPSIQLDDPPIPQPVLDEQQLGDDPNKLMQTVPAARFSRPWIQWLWLLKRFLSQGGSSNLISILAPSVDETDIGWYANGTIDNHTDPVTFNATLTGLTRFGVQVTGGTAYTNGDALTVASSNGQGRPAKGTAVVTAGVITGFILTVQGYNLRPPLVVTGGTGTGAAATLGRQWAVGDYILWNNPSVASSKYSYEIDQIRAITPTDDTHFSCTLARRASGAAAGIAQYGSPIAAQTGINFYRLINKEFFANLDLSAGPQLLRFLWDNMTVAALQISGSGISLLQNLAPPVNTTRYTPPSPGMRTMNGAAYTNLGINGTVVVAQTAAARISAQAWESIRTVYAKVITAPTGATSFGGDANAAIVVYVCYISPGGVVGLIDTLVIDSGQTSSYSASNPPDGRQMPFHGLNQWTRTAPNYDWPPNWLPVCAGALSVSGLLQLPITPSGSNSVQFSPDGQIDFIVGQTGTTVAGANLTIVVQT